MIYSALLLAAAGTEEMEAIIAADVLVRAGFRVDIAGLESGIVKGSRGISFVIDHSLSEVKDAGHDVLVLPGGLGGVENLISLPGIDSLLEDFSSSKRLIAAICAAPLILHRRGYLNKLPEFTSHPSVRGQFGDISERWVDKRTVYKNGILTSQGPGTAFEFAFEIIRIICGDKKVSEINSGILARV
ncbi:DJ-1/PfpI family protein [Myxococcota bacterium]|nr:DJ-1/PfpI family protein [Myxococcota bacterium]MBU1381652.1 DJ-1/PfpI family protein [Myxococcota bacterium]MBU1497568.1 DJ-1/PfpI family protein [Myxococcota bacterium]